MSESMSSPWIHDYLVGAAEAYGAQHYNVPVSKGKKRVQLIDFLTYQENSYVWAWVSDKDYRVSVRISKDAVDEYKSKYGRSIIDSRFFLVFIASYRPMFSPRPLGSNAPGNTSTYHISLDVGYVSSIGTGAHLFGNPRDLELDQNIKDWILGLRQGGGGGNVLKLRKQQELAQNKKAPSCPPCLPPLTLHAPASQCQTTRAAEEAANTKSEGPPDFKRAYAKRWRKIEVDPWKFAAKPATEERQQPNATTPPAEPHLEVASQLESRSLACLTPPRRISSPTSLQRQGTPTNWSPSNRGSPVTPDDAYVTIPENGAQQDDELDFLPASSHLPSDAEGHITVGATMISDAQSFQPPTPAQRSKRSVSPRSSLPPCSSPEMFARSLIPSPQRLPRSSPLPPSSSLPNPSSSLSIPMGIRKNIQRKVPHPGPPAPRSDPTNRPVQVLVPNSDTSGTGSSQSQSQQNQPRLLSHPPEFSSFKPVGASTPKEIKVGNLTKHASKMLAESLTTHGDVDEQEATSADGKCIVERADTSIRGQKSSESTRAQSPAQSIAEATGGKGRTHAVEESDSSSVKVDKKRRRSTQVDPLAQKRAKASSQEVCRTASGGTVSEVLRETRQRDTEVPTPGVQSGNQLSTISAATTDTAALSPVLQLAKPRLANFVVDFSKIDLGKRVPVPRLDFEKDIKGTLLRTGRIRTLGEKVEKDGSVYIHL